MIKAIWFAFVVISAFLLGIQCGKRKAIRDLRNALLNGQCGKLVRIGTTCPTCKGEGMVGVVNVGDMVSMAAREKEDDSDK